MGDIDFNTKEFEELIKRFKKLEKSEQEKFFDKETKKVAGMFLSLVTKETPVDTGYLRNNWTGGAEENPTSFAKKLKVTHMGKSHYVVVSNNTKYASYVNYGHRAPNGRYVLPKKHHFVENAEQSLDSVAPKTIQDDLEKFIQGVVNG